MARKREKTAIEHVVAEQTRALEELGKAVAAMAKKHKAKKARDGLKKHKAGAP